MRFDVLGPMRLERDGELIPLSSGRQRALLANLLLANGTTLSADQLIEAVWGDELPSNPANTLQHGIAQLRKVLEPGRTRSDPPLTLISDGAGYRLDLSNHQSDVADFEEFVERGRALFDQDSHAAAVDAARTALGLWRGRAYADFAYAPFARVEADRLDELQIQARELLADAESARKGPETVVAELEALASDYPYREGIWARLMTALYQSGRQAEALRAYQRASRALGDELGIEPSAELRELEQQILLQDPALTRERRDPIRHNIPAQTTRLVGREETLADLVDFVRSSRLTTLLGPGGSGKTRLALEVAETVVGGFSDGAWLVRLDDLADPDLLAATVGAVVGMPEDRDKAVIDTLVSFLANRQVLVLLDNCEHVVGAVATLAEALLANCRSVTLLATSQVALNVSGEQRVLIPPLRLPGQDGSPFDEIEGAPAVELFLERADAINPGLHRSPSSIAAIANIVQALDGIPLAIELAAARTDLLTPVDIARGLADRFEVLDGGPRDVPERQRTLRNTVEWSYALLDKEEKAFFARLGVFAGAFDAEAAAAVCATNESEASSIIGRLLQRSLVARDPDIPELSRYRLLETLRLYGIEQLTAAGEINAVRDLHLDHYSGMVLRLDDRLIGQDQLAAFAELAGEQDNFRAAMAWSLQSGRLAPGVRIAAWLGRFWDWRGSLAEASTWSRRFLEAQPDEATPDLALLTSWAGFYARELGEEERSTELVAESERIAVSQGDVLGHAAALTGAALQARLRGEYVASIEIVRQIRALAAEIDNLWLIAWADNHDGLSHLAAGDIAAAEQVSTASLRGFEDLGDRRATGWALTALAQVAHEQSDYAKSIEIAGSAVAVSEEAGDGRNAAWALELACEAARSSGDDEAAERYAAEAAALLQERGMPLSPWQRST